MTQIKNLYNLTRQLDKLLINNKNVINAIDIFKIYNGNDWKKYITKTDSYSRSVISRNENYELLLLSWNKFSSTPYHNHPKNGCLIKLVEGVISENTINNTSTNTIKLFYPNDISYKNGNEYHKITALKKSYSLHLYSPPNFYKN